MHLLNDWCRQELFFVPVKRETGENPVRSRHCNKEVLYKKDTEQSLGSQYLHNDL
jgi:hypothetical protein